VWSLPFSKIAVLHRAEVVSIARRQLLITGKVSVILWLKIKIPLDVFKRDSQRIRTKELSSKHPPPASG
jgi:hypothetical protein